MTISPLTEFRIH